MQSLEEPTEGEESPSCRCRKRRDVNKGVLRDKPDVGGERQKRPMRLKNHKDQQSSPVPALILLVSPGGLNVSVKFYLTY